MCLLRTCPVYKDAAQLAGLQALAELTTDLYKRSRTGRFILDVAKSKCHQTIGICQMLRDSSTPPTAIRGHAGSNELHREDWQTVSG
jgi:hypothetical protein